MKQLTTQQRQRVEQEIKNTQQALDKELGYSEDLQKPERIEFLTNHISKLNGMLVNGWNAPTI